MEHWAVLVITPHNRLNLGSTKALKRFLSEEMDWLNPIEPLPQPRPQRRNQVS